MATDDVGCILEVGVLAYLREHDPDGMTYHLDRFEAENELLRNAGREVHEEPQRCQPWSVELPRGAPLVALRRLAAHLDQRRPLPSPLTPGEADDAALEAYVQDYLTVQPGVLKSLFGKPRKFARLYDHLVLQYDSAIYLPRDFQNVIGGPKHETPWSMIGSASRLLEELDDLAAALEIPSELTWESVELRSAALRSSVDGPTWRRYGLESFTCAALREGCRRSMRTGAALLVN